MCKYPQNDVLAIVWKFRNIQTNDGCFQRDVPKGNLQVLADTIIYEYGQAILFRFFRMLTWRVARVLLRSNQSALYQTLLCRARDEE